MEPPRSRVERREHVSRSRFPQRPGFWETGTGGAPQASGVAAPRRRRYERRKMPPRSGARSLGPWTTRDPMASSWSWRACIGADAPRAWCSTPPSLFGNVLRCSGEWRYGPSKCVTTSERFRPVRRYAASSRARTRMDTTPLPSSSATRERHSSISKRVHAHPGPSDRSLPVAYTARARVWAAAGRSRSLLVGRRTAAGAHRPCRSRNGRRGALSAGVVRGRVVRWSGACRRRERCVHDPLGVLVVVGRVELAVRQHRLDLVRQRHGLVA
jgi:hypothetical protein